MQGRFSLPPRIQQLLHLKPFLRPYKKPLIIGSLTVLLTNATAILGPWILRAGIDHLTQEIRLQLIVLYASLIVAASLVEGVFRYGMRRILIGVSRRVEYDLRNAIFGHLQTLSRSFFQKHSTGDIMARSTNDLNAVRMVLGPAIMYSLNTLFNTVLVISVLLSLNWRLALLVLIPLTGVSIAVQYFGKRIHQRFEKIQAQFSDLTTLVQENLAGVRVVKAYNQEAAFVDRFRQANQDYLSKNLSLIRLESSFDPLLGLLLGLSTLILLWFGGRLVVQDVISLGDFVAFIAYIGMLYWPVIALGWVINIFERGAASMGRLNQILHSRPDVDDSQARPIGSIRGEIEVKGLTFAYNGTPVLRDVSFRVQAGQTLAVVGRTGSGKTTLASLLCRLYPVPEGKIRIDGNDINHIPLDTLRSSIGYAPQEPFLFSESIRDNIAYGRPRAAQPKIEEVADVSNIRPDIEDFPSGYDTFVGERGITLSGGQKQRISISRALLVDPRILILDDTLSAVDTQTEDRILQRLAQELAGRTAVLISHRVSTVQGADQILVLDKGQVVEKGTHSQLLDQGGYYAGLYEKQLLQEELERQ